VFPFVDFSASWHLAPSAADESLSVARQAFGVNTCFGIKRIALNGPRSTPNA
jgi:hypothetical protein